MIKIVEMFYGYDKFCEYRINEERFNYLNKIDLFSNALSCLGMIPDEICVLHPDGSLEIINVRMGLWRLSMDNNFLTDEEKAELVNYFPLIIQYTDDNEPVTVNRVEEIFVNRDFSILKSLGTASDC